MNEKGAKIKYIDKTGDKLKQWLHAFESVKYKNGHIKCKLEKKTKDLAHF